MSVFGLLSKRANSVEAGRLSAWETIVRAVCMVPDKTCSSRFVLLLFIILMISGCLIPAIKKEKLAVQGDWLFLFASSTMMLIVVGLATDLWYVGIAVPLLVFSLAGIEYDLLKNNISQWMKYILIGMILLFCGVNFMAEFKAVQMDNEKNDYYRNLAMTHEDEPAIYVRNYKSEFRMAEYLEKAEEALVVTLPNSSLGKYSNDGKLRSTEKVLVYIVNNEQVIDDTILFLKNDLGFQQLTDLTEGTAAENGEMVIYEAKRDRHE